MSDAACWPVGAVVPNWQGAERPERRTLEGCWCRVEPLSVERHADSLWAAMTRADAERHWTYLSYGPFADASAYRAWLADVAVRNDPLFFAIIDKATGCAVGVASFLRIAPGAGTIEVGHINFSPLLQRRPAASEAMFLMMRYAFSLGYRRYEWKCDALNQPSRRAALRLGFTYEGVFRQATVVRGRNRDTAWYSIIDSEWLVLERAFTTWLATDNFDAEGHQRVALSSLTGPQA